MSASSIAVGVVFQRFGWRESSRMHIYDGRGSPDVALVLAPQVLHSDYVVTVSACRGVVAMPALTQHSSS